MTKPSAMVIGSKYRITTQSDAQRYPREHVLSYLGDDLYNLYFDARPQLGTQTVPRNWIIKIENVDQSTNKYMNRRAG